MSQNDSAQSAATTATLLPAQLTLRCGIRCTQVLCHATFALVCTPSRVIAIYGIPSFLLIFLAFTATRATQIDQLVNEVPQKITVLKSKVGRPPKKKPKLGQWNSHYTESVMTRPMPRISTRPASSSVSGTVCPASATGIANPAVQELVARSPAATPLQPITGDCLQLAQLQYVQTQQRVSNLFSLAQIQQPPASMLSQASDQSPRHSLIDSTILNHYLRGGLQLPPVMMPRLDAPCIGQCPLLQLGTLQQNAYAAQQRELFMAALMASLPPNLAFLERLQQIELARQQLSIHLSSL